MNITQEKIDELNAVLKIEVSEEDYQQKVDKELKDHQKKMNLPVFHRESAFYRSEEDVWKSLNG